MEKQLKVKDIFTDGLIKKINDGKVRMEAIWQCNGEEGVNIATNISIDGYSNLVLVNIAGDEYGNNGLTFGTDDLVEDIQEDYIFTLLEKEYDMDVLVKFVTVKPYKLKL